MELRQLLGGVRVAGLFSFQRCVVCLFCLHPVHCVPNFAKVSELSILDYAVRFL
jgi:hypothetical protein